MKVKLPPKDRVLRGASFPQVLRLELNDFDVESLLPELYFRVLAHGKRRARRPKELDPEVYIDKLSNHPDLEGFRDEDGKRLLSRLTYTALITTSRIGRARKGIQILNVVPYNLLAHKSGFPTSSSRLRNVDTFLYQSMRDSLQGVDRARGGEYTLANHFKNALGTGVRLNNPPQHGGTYDGHTRLDTLSRLSIALLETMEPSPEGQPQREQVANAFPALSGALAEDIIGFIFKYSSRMPPQAFTYALQTLINFELFSYTLKVTYATAQLVADPTQIPVAMASAWSPSPPEFYVDFSGDRSGPSFEMASGCVSRDLEAYQRHNFANLKLRLLHHYAEALKRDTRRRGSLENILGAENAGAEYLQGLLVAADDRELGMLFSASAQHDETRIREVNKVDADEEYAEPEALDWIDTLLAGAETDVDRVVTLLYEAQAKSLQKNSTSWYRKTGGMDKDYGLLAGTTKNRLSWRYAPANDLLSVLVQLAAISATDEGTVAAATHDPKPIRLRAFLHYLTERFGVLIDRPPGPYRGAEYVAAARGNLRALEGRLRQMGIFSDLSDDFTLQQLSPPYMQNTSFAGEAN